MLSRSASGLPANTSSGQLAQGADGVGVGVGAQDSQGGGELLARLGVPTRLAQGLPGRGLRPGRSPGFASVHVAEARAFSVLDCPVPLGASGSRNRGPLP